VPGLIDAHFHAHAASLSLLEIETSPLRTVAWASMSAHSWNQPYRRCFWPFFRWSHRRVSAPLVSSSGTVSRRGGKSSAGGRSPVSILLITSFETWTSAARSFWDTPARVR
jgi:hypothetical protein